MTDDHEFSPKEAQRRFEAAIRGARLVGHRAGNGAEPKPPNPRAEAQRRRRERERQAQRP